MSSIRKAKRDAITTATVLQAIRNAATEDIPLNEAAAQLGLGPSVLNRWFRERSDDLMAVLDALAIARIAQIPVLMQLQSEATRQLLERVEGGDLSSSQLLQIVKFAQASLEREVKDSGLDSSVKDEAQEYLENLGKGPELLPVKSRYYD